MAKKYVGSITHTEETIHRMFKTEELTYNKMGMLLRMASGAVLVVASFVIPMHTLLQVVLLAVGSWLLISRDFPSNSRAERAIEARGGALPVNTLTFSDSNVVLEGEGSMPIPYSRFQRLIQDDRYLYLFLGKGSVCMIDKETVHPGSAKDLMEFVEKKTGLKWDWCKSLMLMNVKDMIQALKDFKNR